MKDELPISTKIYLRAAELIEQGHCKGVFARDDLGHMLCIFDGFDRAVSFCYYGARVRAAEELGYKKERNEILNEFALQVCTPNSMSSWNDHPDTTAEMVAAKLREQAFA